MYRKISSKLLSKIGIYFLTLLVHIIVIPFYNVPVIVDEVNPLALGFMIRGENWTQYLIANGYYYKYGQLLFYLPFVLLIKNNFMLYRVLLIVNALIVSFVPVCVYEILTKYLRSVNIKRSFQMALLVGFIPAVLLNSKFIWAESFLLIIPWLIMLLFFKVIERNISTFKMWIYSILIAMLQVYAFMVHTRGIVIFIATVLCTIFIRIILNEKNVKLTPYFIVTIILYFVDLLLVKIFRNYLYNGDRNLIGGTISFINNEFIKNIVSLTGIRVLGEGIIGWLFASVSSTLGLTCLGLIISITIILNTRKWREYSHQELIIVLFGLLLFGGSLMMGILFFFNDLFVNAGIEIVRRGDKIIYTRYLDSANVCVSFIGLYYLLIKERPRIKSYIFYSGISFVFMHGFFVSKIADRINHTITWSQILMSVNYFCDLNQCIRGGAYSTIGYLSGGIAFFGLFAIIIFIITMKYRKNTKFFLTIYLVCFLAGYFWNAYNVIYRMDNYQASLITEYEDIIRCVNNEEGLKIIYLDDEISRCSFQYIFSDYQIVAQRDKDSVAIKDMFIISPKGIYNQDLYNKDYFEIVDSGGVNEDYHLYIKGDWLNEILTENGYVTREVMQSEVE